ncbi:branched-chain amino acid transport system substrate-binding protein [Variovorax sp. OK605]|uniref:ABC transporter substrate-binding protein n=1 Tax=Variovorax sp. OK605 TaxID=1855317 RepID=UPI0008E1D861|nr:ABC transporter substrate-binding protein [Variovorax sp. OK605]SFQ75295.1 branched-chain amino acid transport system substrate-binding protein [Variovorax sp. OK605]
MKSLATLMAWGTAVFALATAATVAMAQPQSQPQRPAEIKLGMSTFMTGPASVLGTPAKAAADMWIEDFNAAGGIDGTRLSPTWIDEGQGADKFLSEYRRLAQEPGEKLMLSAISSGYCNALAPVAEDLKVINILWECSTEKVLEERRYKYVFRTGPNGTMEMVAAVLHLLKTKPDFKTLAVVNQDYAWGRDSWEIFRNTLLALKPDVKIVAELFPKFGASDFSTEVTRLQALRPDVVLSTAWGGDLDTFLRQASQRGLLKSSQFVLPLADSSLERLGDAVPPGVIVGFVGDGYFADPEFANDPEARAFVQKFKKRTGAYPNFAVYHMVQALKAATGAYKQALADNKGQWPTTDQLAATLRKLEYRGLSRPIRLREDGQALQGQLYGVTAKDASQPFPVARQLSFYPAEILTPPVGQKSAEWVKTLKPALIQSPQIRRVGD